METILEILLLYPPLPKLNLSWCICRWSAMCVSNVMRKCKILQDLSYVLIRDTFEGDVFASLDDPECMGVSERLLRSASLRPRVRDVRAMKYERETTAAAEHTQQQPSDY